MIVAVHALGDVAMAVLVIVVESVMVHARGHADLDVHVVVLVEISSQFTNEGE